MNSEDIFKKIVTIDTLLAFNGVIPSLSEFQLKLVTLVEQFSHTLQSEGHDETEVDHLCHQLCHYIDKRAGNAIREKGLSWEGYALVHYFYGYEASTGSDNLESLLNSEDATISQYALKILSLAQNLPTRDEQSQRLLSRYSHRPTRQNLIGTKEDIDAELDLKLKLGTIETNDAEPQPEVAVPPAPRTGWRPFYLQIFALILLLSALWFWCSRYLGDMS